MGNPFPAGRIAEADILSPRCLCRLFFLKKPSASNLILSISAPRYFEKYRLNDISSLRSGTYHFQREADVPSAIPIYLCCHPKSIPTFFPHNLAAKPETNKLELQSSKESEQILRDAPLERAPTTTYHMMSAPPSQVGITGASRIPCFFSI